MQAKTKSNYGRSSEARPRTLLFKVPFLFYYIKSILIVNKCNETNNFNLIAQLERSTYILGLLGGRANLDAIKKFTFSSLANVLVFVGGMAGRITRINVSPISKLQRLEFCGKSTLCILAQSIKKGSERPETSPFSTTFASNAVGYPPLKKIKKRPNDNSNLFGTCEII